MLLKRAVRELLPPGIAERKKKGFGIPVAAWLKTGLREPLLDLLSPARLAAQGLFDAREVDRLVHEHLAGARDHRKQLWTLLMFQLWHDAFAAARTAPPRPPARRSPHEEAQPRLGRVPEGGLRQRRPLRRGRRRRDPRPGRFPYPFADDEFDVVEAAHCLEHLPEPFAVDARDPPHHEAGRHGADLGAALLARASRTRSTSRAST